MITCKDCQAEISKQAKACPKCGAPVKRGSVLGMIGKGFLVLIALSAVLAYINTPESTSSPPAQAAAPAPEPVRYDKSAEAQAKRKDLLERSGKGGLVAKVDCRAQGADVWVNPMFDVTSFDMKNGLAVTVHQWCFDGPDDGFVRIRSNQTNKELGMYRPASGLDLE